MADHYGRADSMCGIVRYIQEAMSELRKLKDVELVASMLCDSSEGEERVGLSARVLASA